MYKKYKLITAVIIFGMIITSCGEQKVNTKSSIEIVESKHLEIQKEEVEKNNKESRKKVLI